MKLQTSDGEATIRAVDEPIFFGAVWRPQTDTGHAPDTVSLLCTEAPVDWAPYMTDAPVIVPVRRCSDWLDAGRDTIPLQEAPDTVGLELILSQEEVGTAN